MYLAKAPSVADLMGSLNGQEAVAAMMAPADVMPTDRYLHWDKLRRLPPPEHLSSEQWWLKIKMARSDEMRLLPLTSSEGEPFGFTLPDAVLRQLSYIDQRGAGEVVMEEVVTSEREAGKRFLVNSLMEEAIRSSQLEGATTSRMVAKELLRSGRPPKDRSELMIANNYRALQYMREEMGDVLSPESILELHRIVTEGTLDDAEAAGRLQRPNEQRVAVFDRDDGKPIHVPPPAEQLPERMRLLCEFANRKNDQGRFVPPVVRAILLHFWLAYDHPFEDGNGRTARILYFWAMQKSGYWLAEYLPISRVIRKAPTQYARAFVEAETDVGDTTYFVIHQLGVIEQAIADLHLYLQHKIEQMRDVESLLQGDTDLNGRQLALLTNAVRHPGNAYSFESHGRSHRVSHETARTDLGRLVNRGLLTKRRRGHRFVFEPAPDLEQRLKESTS